MIVLAILWFIARLCFFGLALVFGAGVVFALMMTVLSFLFVGRDLGDER